MATIKGNPLTTLLELCEGHEFTRDQNGNDELTITYVCKWSERNDLLPAIGSSAAAAGYPTLSLSGVKTTRDEAGQAQIALTYRGSLLTFDGLPVPSYRLTGAGQEVPIEQHPKFSEFTGWDADNEKFETGSVLEGVKSYFAPGATWTKVFYNRNSPSQSDLFNLGNLDNPEGLRDVVPGYWQFMGMEATNQGAFWQYEKTWQYEPTKVRVDQNGLTGLT